MCDGIMKRLVNHFSWSDWTTVGEQLDSYKNERYEVFRKVNKNGLSRYKKVLIVKSACHPQEARVV